MGMMISTIAALSTFYHDAKDIFNAESRQQADLSPDRQNADDRGVFLSPLAGHAVRLSRQRAQLSRQFPEHAVPHHRDCDTAPNPTLEHALDILFILHADHEQNCSANTMRGVGSSHVDPYSATAAAIAALYGPLHGGANEEVVRMLMEIGSVQKVPDFIKRVKAGETKLMGFGHRVYKNYDPRARIIKQIAYEVFDLMGKNPLLEIALECERIALEDEYFVKRKLYPNVDFYTGLIYQSMGFPIDHVPGAVRDSAHFRLDRAVGRDAARSRAENCAAAPDLPRPRHAPLRPHRPALT